MPRRRAWLALDGDRGRRALCAGRHRSYPSSVLMNAVPARVAGVERIVMVVPARDGALNPVVLAAARIAGVTEIYRIGGAQAVAALAYGTETIRPVAKIVGPGQRLGGRGQAPGLRHRRHRHDRRAVGSAGDGRPRQQSRLDRRRSARPGRARSRRAIDPDDATMDFGDAVVSRRSSCNCDASAAPRRRAASWADFGAVIWCPTGTTSNPARQPHCRRTSGNRHR
jgi:histidinol dehydrogenase